MNRRGFTLVELIVVLVLTGLLYGIGTLAFAQVGRSARTVEAVADSARRAALRSGTAVRLVQGGPVPEIVLALPDGRLLVSTGFPR